jgi:hypothetical protein
MKIKNMILTLALLALVNIRGGCGGGGHWGHGRRWQQHPVQLTAVNSTQATHEAAN